MDPVARRPPDGEIRLARLRDVGRLGALYRLQLEHPPRKLTPFPFDRVRLSAILLLVVLSRRVLPVVRRLAPGLCTWILVAVAPDGVLVGVGFLHLVRDADGAPLGRTGLLVHPDRRRIGWGTRLKLELLRQCQRVGLARVQSFLDPRNAGSIGVNRRLGLSIRENGPGDPVRPMGRYLVSEGEVTKVLAAYEARSSDAYRN